MRGYNQQLGIWSNANISLNNRVSLTEACSMQNLGFTVTNNFAGEYSSKWVTPSYDQAVGHFGLLLQANLQAGQKFKWVCRVCLQPFQASHIQKKAPGFQWSALGCLHQFSSPIHSSNKSLTLSQEVQVFLAVRSRILLYPFEMESHGKSLG